MKDLLNTMQPLMTSETRGQMEAFGRKDTLQGHARRFGIHHETVRTRMRRQGMTLEQALSTPKDKGHGTSKPKRRHAWR